jgi:tetratricopeptide (TPR) repeat protein
MYRTDRLGVSLTTESDLAARHWSDTVEHVLSHAAATPASLAATLEADPDFALAHAAKGIMLMTLARGELVGAARAALATARAAAARRPVTVREQGYVQALDALIDGRPFAAADRLEANLVGAPHDILALKFGQAIRFMAGDRSGMLTALETRARAFEPGVPLAGYVFGCRAFALEEAGRYGEAEAAGRLGIEIAPRDAWGRHAVAHVMEMTGRFDDGIGFLNKPSAWAHCNNFGSHIVWHLALFLLESRRIDEVFAHYDQSIRADRTDDFRDIANGASLLMRLELLGHDVGDRWEELADIAERRATDRRLVFADLHYLLALLRAGRDDAASSLVQALTDDAAMGRSWDAEAARRAGVSAAEGLVAFEAGDYDRAARHLNAAAPELGLIGGSHAQRDIFEQVRLTALMEAGRGEEAERLLDRRLARRGGRNAIAERLLAVSSRRRVPLAARLADHAVVPEHGHRSSHGNGSGH